ncbi:sialic acid-binding Ig-like lectin 10 [Elgaria multicarinata webbii]|uniref:sialic acid-binding Ig-like lectin 10 n=1 Tax=Elgaria multicarinata webbii TaxID=159646 RepID=UPI002FCCDF96
MSWNEKLFAYWFKDEPGNTYNFKYKPWQSVPGRLVATNDDRDTVESFAINRFHLTGNPNQGNCSFSITNAKFEDEGQYYFRIQGDKNLKFSYLAAYGHTLPRISVTEQPRNVQITVKITRSGRFGVPSIQTAKGDLDPVVVQEGDAIKLICRADGRPDPILTWRKESKTIGDPKQGAEYLLPKITPEDAGAYQCQAVHCLSSAKNTVWITVQYPPRTVTFRISQASMRDPALIQDYPREVANGSQLTAQEGDSLQILCKVDSNPPVETSWVKAGRTSEKFSANLLELTNLTLEDEGKYVCNATNPLGSSWGIFQLNVAYAPKFSRTPPKNTTCWYADSGFLCSCSLHSQPPPHIQWQVDGETVTEGSSKQQVTSFAQGNDITSSLNWTGSLNMDHRIICFGSNPFGVYTMHFLMSALRGSTTSSSSTGNRTPLFVSGLCGALLAAGLFLLGLCLIKFFKRRKTPSKAGTVQPVDPAVTGGNQRAKNNFSLIYSNILPVGPRRPHVGPSKVAAERNPKRGPIPKVPKRNTAEPDPLHYAALEFKPKSNGAQIPREESVEYSAIRQK